MIEPKHKIPHTIYRIFGRCSTAKIPVPPWDNSYREDDKFLKIFGMAELAGFSGWEQLILW